MLSTLLIEEFLTYSGKELSSHWIYRNYHIQGDAIIAFHGPCDVQVAEMVDLEDVKSNLFIFSENMLHILVEHFCSNLKEIVLLQRLLVSQVHQILLDCNLAGIRRIGDDLYDGEHKLSVSIATVSPVSGLIHFGLNISSENTPVKTRGLKDYHLDWETIANTILQVYSEEYKSLYNARSKVNWVQ